MARHPQSTPRGLLAAKALLLSDQTVTANSTGLLFTEGIRLNAARYIRANSTGFILTAESAIPATDQGAAFTIISNSTGVCLAVNTTGTTWKYLDVTSKQPT